MQSRGNGGARLPWHCGHRVFRTGACREGRRRNRVEGPGRRTLSQRKVHPYIATSERITGQEIRTRRTRKKKEGKWCIFDISHFYVPRESCFTQCFTKTASPHRANCCRSYQKIASPMNRATCPMAAVTHFTPYQRYGHVFLSYETY